MESSFRSEEGWGARCCEGKRMSALRLRRSGRAGGGYVEFPLELLLLLEAGDFGLASSSGRGVCEEAKGGPRLEVAFMELLVGCGEHVVAVQEVEVAGKSILSAEEQRFAIGMGQLRDQVAEVVVDGHVLEVARGDVVFGLVGAEE